MHIDVLAGMTKAKQQLNFKHPCSHSQYKAVLLL
jgi:hypothetical protein